LLEAQARKALGEAVDISSSHLRLSSGLELPNPLQVYEEMLSEFIEVNISTVHGDFNLENILIDPETRDVSVIDFATVHRGHNLHDLLRLETEVVTKLIPEILKAHDLPPETIYSFYRQLDRTTFGHGLLSELENFHPELEKAFATIKAVRQEARKCIFDTDDPTEYYRGLILYLLGALKFKNLDEIPHAKATALMGAAATVGFLRPDGSPDWHEAPAGTPGEAPAEDADDGAPAPGPPAPRRWLRYAAGLLLIAVIVVVYLLTRPVPVAHLDALDDNLTTEIIDGPAAADDLLSYFALANPDLFDHIEVIEQAYLDGTGGKGLTYIWGSPGVGKSFISRNRLSAGFPGPSCLVKLGDLFDEDTAKLDFEVTRKADLMTLDGQERFDDLPAVAETSAYDLEGMLSAASCVQNEELVPLIIVDDIDEVHSETSNLILRSLDRLVLETEVRGGKLLQVVVLGRSEGFATWYRDPKRNDDIAEFLRVYHLNGPEFLTRSDVEVLADNQIRFVLGNDIWEEMIKGGAAEGQVEAYVQYVSRHPILPYSIRVLAIATMITDRSLNSTEDSDRELKSFLFNEMLRRASDVHGRPAAGDDQYQRILELIAVRYAGEELVDDQGFFTVGFNDTVKVRNGVWSSREVLVRQVLDHSGIAIVEPASFSLLRYRFDPVWVHPFLVELRNQRVNPLYP
jgi:hypothetical protein